MPLYAAGLAVKDWLRAAGFLKTRRLEWPVVSVGSLSAGGAGKTPVVIALALLMKDRGWGVNVLSRGYGRRGQGVERVTGSDPARFGDEPVLIARAAGVEVWVGAERFAAGKAAEEGSRRALGVAAGAMNADPQPSAKDDNKNKANRSVHLLDDGFQHRQLARGVDVVLVTAEDLEDALLPAGNLREPLRALLRADVVVVRMEEWVLLAPKLRELVREGTAMWSVERKLLFPAPLRVLSAGLRPVAFCAVARPEGFAAMVQEAGCGLIETVAFRDHHAYTAADIEHIVKVAQRLNASGLVTTEKDAVKLSAAMRDRLQAVGPLVVVALVAEFVNPAEVVSDLEERLA